MTKYIALLRGINVGGNNIISMKELKAAFERRGFSNVSTYINSGNVIFESGVADIGELKQICEKVQTKLRQDSPQATLIKRRIKALVCI